MHNTDPLDYYFVLNISTNATQDEIEDAHDREAVTWAAYESDAAKERLKRIEAAYAVLSQPLIRAMYDAPALEAEQRNTQDLETQWLDNTMTVPQGAVLVHVPIKTKTKREEQQERFQENRSHYLFYALINGIFTPAALVALAYYIPSEALWAVPVAVALAALTLYASIKTNLWQQLTTSGVIVPLLGRVELWLAIIAATGALVFFALVVIAGLALVALALAIVSAAVSN